MTEEKQKNKSGAGKFFLGALLGGVAGAIAGKFIRTKTDEEESEGCECGDECNCHEEDKKNTIKSAPVSKKEPEGKTKKTGEKK